MKLQLKDSSASVSCTPEMLEKHFSITYLPSHQYAHWEIERYLCKKSQKAHKRGKIKQLTLWLGTLHSKKMAQDFWPDVTIRWVCPKKGYGVFANVPFEQWSYMGQYSGIVRPRKIIYPDLNDYCFMYPRQWLNLRPMTIDSEKAGNYTRFINHSDYPNLESIAAYYEGAMYIIFRAIRPIAVGDELTYDYGDVYWDKRIKIAESV